MTSSVLLEHESVVDALTAFSRGRSALALARLADGLIGITVSLCREAALVIVAAPGTSQQLIRTEALFAPVPMRSVEFGSSGGSLDDAACIVTFPGRGAVCLEPTAGASDVARVPPGWGRDRCAWMRTDRESLVPTRTATATAIPADGGFKGAPQKVMRMKSQRV
jgi:hypothetical protein